MPYNKDTHPYMEFATIFPKVSSLSNQELWRIHQTPISDYIKNTPEYLAFRQQIDNEIDRRINAKTMELHWLISAK